MWYFKIVSNFIRLMARDISYNDNFETSLVVFMPNIIHYKSCYYRNKEVLIVWSHAWIIFFFASLRMCAVQLRWNGRKITTILNEVNQSLKRKKIGRRLFRFSRKTSHHEILCLSRVATAKKSDQKACVIMHVQSNVLLVKPHCLDVLTLLELPIMKPIGRI